MKTRRRARQWFVDGSAILIGLAALVPVIWIHADDERMSADGQITTGVVQGKETIEGGGETPTTYRLRYVFEDASGRKQAGSAGVEHSIYKTTSVGARLPIQYLPDQPQRSRIAGTFDPGILEALVLTALGFIYFFLLGPERWFKELRGEPDPVLT
jgi:hypothetical protein